MFRLLGPIEARVGEEALDVGQPIQRTVLAALLFDAGRVVQLGTVIERVWDGAPPASAPNVVYGHLSRIRRLLAHATELGAEDVELRRSGSGYLLDPGRELVDLHRFRALAKEARGDGSARGCAALFRQALDLWSGTPLADLSGAWADRVREALRWERLEVFLGWARAMLDLDEPEPILREARELLADHPRSEPLAELLIRALYALGRVAEALDCYEAVRQRLADELGADPSRELQQIHAALLRGEPDPSGPPPPPPPGEPTTGTPPPAQLLPDLASWTGRGAEVEQLTRVTTGPAPAGAATVAVIHGMAGVGKTALAVHVAHRIADRFDAGQIFIDLHGFAHGALPMSPEAALDRLLRSIGVPGRRIPHTLEEQAGLWRVRTDGRKLLLILDNAADEEQLRPLLPASGSVVVLVTSRRQLSLAGIQDAHQLPLEPLPPDEAVAMFTTVAGPGPVGAEDPAGIAEATELCGHLPLAIRLLATRLRSRPAWRLSDVLARIRVLDHRLAELQEGDHDLVPILQDSYDQLDPGEKRLFRLLGLHPGSFFDPHTASALADITIDQAERRLESLADQYLLQSPAYRRYTFHDLLRAQATAAAHREETGTERRYATERLLDHYLHTASIVMDTYAPEARHLRPSVDPASTPTPSFEGRAQALAWLDTERPNLIAAASDAAQNGRPDYVGKLSQCLARYLTEGGHVSEAITLHDHAVGVAREQSDLGAEARALYNLGVAHAVLRQNTIALDHLTRAHQRLPANDDGYRSAILRNLGFVLEAMGRYTESADHLEQAADLDRENHDHYGEARAASFLSAVLCALGKVTAAETYAQRTLTLARRIDDMDAEAGAHYAVGRASVASGRYRLACTHLRESQRLFHARGATVNEPLALAKLAEALYGLGEYTESLEQGGRALSLALEQNNPNSEYEARLSIGRTLHAAGRASEAIEQLHTALNLACDLAQPYDQARAHRALGRIYGSTGDTDQAREHTDAAQRIHRNLGLPTVDQVR